MQDDMKKPPGTEHDSEDEFLRERLERYGQRRQAPFDPFFRPRLRKNKWIAGLLSFCIPGTGQFYLGLMQRGLSMMLLFFLDIFAIVFFATNGNNIPLVVLFSLLVPVIYFYNIFDALQQTDKVNHAEIPGFYGESMPGEAPAGGFPNETRGSSNLIGYVLIGIGALLFLAGGKPAWLERVFEMAGSSVGALILIGVGAYMFYKESKKK
ncbi:hypothetical protein PAESOLCIP111_06495 [Paenibacillus solanacearum]|uniref:Uncharacterized protein n=1 Tax=Paenibacillus solanacearum TaxID=2048548 RepID=A0A916K818_9BACL|nr:hypothetical protein [Paenibacillus solanacearum]CAG7652276.1 hypothetical protein PAESOLCIP111_06495 [Paenibacillus solanacearum]